MLGILSWPEWPFRSCAWTRRRNRDLTFLHGHLVGFRRVDHSLHCRIASHHENNRGSRDIGSHRQNIPMSPKYSKWRMTRSVQPSATWGWPDEQDVDSPLQSCHSPTDGKGKEIFSQTLASVFWPPARLPWDFPILRLWRWESESTTMMRCIPAGNISASILLRGQHCEHSLGLTDSTCSNHVRDLSIRIGGSIVGQLYRIRKACS